MFLPPRGSECVVGEIVWPRSRTDGWAEGLAEVSFSFSLSALPPSCCVTSLARVLRSARATARRKAFQHSAWETPISQTIIRHTVASSSLSVCLCESK